MATDPKISALEIDPGCIACGLCAQLVPEVFSVPDGGTSQVLGAWLQFVESDPRARQRLIGARDSCPVEVIRVRFDGAENLAAARVETRGGPSLR